MSISEKTTHVSEGLSKLIGRYKDSTNFKNVISSFLLEIQALEAELYKCFSTYDPEVAVSESASDRLDKLGALVGELRQGRDDATYLIFIAVRILLNKSGGTPEQLMTLVQSLPDAWGSIVHETYPLAFILEITDPVDPLLDDMPAVLNFLQLAKAATVEVQLAYTPDGIGASFSFDASGPGFDDGAFGTTI